MIAKNPQNKQRPTSVLFSRYFVLGGSILMFCILGITLIMVHQSAPEDLFTQISLIGAMFILAFIALLHQLRESRLLKQQMTEKDKFLTSVLTNSIDAIIFIDKDNRIQGWNRGAELIFGYTEKEMIGQTFHRLIPPNVSADDELNRIAEVVRLVGFIKNYRAQRITRTGKRITVDLSRTMIYSDKNEPIGSTAIIRDVTEKEEMDKLIYNTEKLASIGTLAAGVAHEINNPLAIILGFTDLLKEKFATDSAEHNDLSIIEENANSAKKIVEDMLGFARITEGQEDRIDIKHSLERVLEIARVTFRQDDISFVIDIADNLPLTRGDSREFQQVIFNLINNAMAAMVDTGGVLTLIAAQDNGTVNITVADTGVGIPANIQGQVFDPFFTTKAVGEGTGLGLSLCYGIVKKYGGNLDFTSVAKEDHPDQSCGTVFTVTMPVVSPAQSQQGDD